jgi:hypothetical protein
MLPDGAHLRGEDWTIFYLGQSASSAVAPMLSHEEVRSGPGGNARASMFPSDDRPKRGAPGGGLLYVLNCVRCREDKSVRRGAQVKAMALATPHPYVQVYKVRPTRRVWYVRGRLNYVAVVAARSGRVLPESGSRGAATHL